ncbi:uncharacterized mitochondrial protein AtMg00310-like [Carya illinoinensis]|uniref:uncharacterized mitochondrial protein AtMg00310-like n=1 Tax=Carya illinoinensis TaxID=32201 RepID=UPI001C723EED|nr:uncharacterized mitochondrial protein AtMg00310-like [Carya illinoinensis]
MKDMGARQLNNSEKYLGLLVMVGRSKYNSFRVIKDRVWKKINNWKNQFLSPSGKEVLLKAVIQAIPTYYMSVFKHPKNLCKEIAAQMAKFWWRFKKDDHKIHWKSWAKMGTAKSGGGLGFREIESFNMALLAKQCWRVLTKPQSMAAMVLKDKYFRHFTILDSNLGHRPSVMWRSLWGSLELLKEGLVWRVGNGRQINI